MASKRDFARLIKPPFERAFSIPNIKSGFAKCGLCQFNRNQVPVMKMMPSSLPGAGSSESSPVSSAVSVSRHPVVSSVPPSPPIASAASGFAPLVESSSRSG